MGSEHRDANVGSPQGSAVRDHSNIATMSRDEKIALGVRNAGGPAKGVLTELYRMTGSYERQISEALEKRCDALGFRLEHLGVTIGTVIHGPNLAEELSDEEVAAIYCVLLERKVIFFRGQDLDYDAHKNFGLRFGSLEVFPFGMP